MTDSGVANGDGNNPLFHLHSYFRSSCSARLRIACNLKNIPVSYSYINLLAKDQASPSYSKINPSRSVPTLTPIPIATQKDKSNNETPSHPKESWPITQSIAALEYLEELFPDRTTLLPPTTDPLARAQVRVLVGIIASDTQPVTNLRILRRVKGLGADPSEWAKDLMTDGLTAFEEVVRTTAGTYSVGDQISLADLCLVPAVWGAQRYGVKLDSLPVLMGVYERVSELDAVKKAHWKCQEDTPEDLRG